MHGDPRQTNTSTLLFSITKKAHLVQNRRTDMSTRCWVETNSAHAAFGQHLDNREISQE